MEHRYGMRLRGFAPACQPKEGLLYREDDPYGNYHDVLVYDRELTEAETTAYELDPLGTGAKHHKEPVTTEDLFEVAADDPEQAINLLLLLGPDCYDGDYEDTMAQLEVLLA